MDMACLNHTLEVRNLSHMSTEGLSSSRAVKYYVMTIAVPCICALGLVGNLLSLAVLTKERLHRTLTKMEISAHIGLMALAVSDFLFCLLVLLFTQTEIKPSYEQGDAVIYFDFVANGLITLFIITSTWLTVVMAAERYIAVCHPLQARKLISLRRTSAGVVIVFLICAFCTIAIFLERKIVEFRCHDERPVYMLVERSRDFVRFRRITWAVLYDVIPSVALVYFNVCLIIQIHRAKSLRDQMTPKHSVVVYSSSGTHVSDTQLISTRHVPSSYKSADTKKTNINLHSINMRGKTERSLQGHGHSSGRGKEFGQFSVSSIGEKQNYKACCLQGSNSREKHLMTLKNCRLERLPNGSSNLRVKSCGIAYRRRHSDSALNSVTATLVAVVLCFLILVSPGELLKFSVSYTPADRDQAMIVTYVTNFMQVLNFSFNFVLYCAINKSFRQTLNEIVCCCWLAVHV